MAEVMNGGALTVVTTNPMAVAQRRVLEFAQQPAVRRSLPLIALMLVTVLGFVIYSFVKTPPMRELFPQLADGEKAAVLDTLKKQGMNVEIDSQTGLLRVPESDFYRAKVLLAQAGLPKTTTSGYELLSQMPMGVSQPVEQARLRQTQETELARTIAEIDPIESARVHLAIAPRSALVRETPEARASVVLKVATGRSLGEGQVAAIIHMVSSSIPYLPSANVTVVDQSGKLLSSSASSAEMQLSDDQMQHQTQVERRYRERVLALLSPIVGYQNLSTEVTAQLDFTKVESTKESFDDPVQVRSEQTNTSERTDGGARGVPGTLSNTPPSEPALSNADKPAADAKPADAAAAPLPPASKTSSSTRNFEIGREVKTVQGQSAFLKKLSVAVIIRESPEATAARAESASKAKGKPDAKAEAAATQMAQIEKLVKDAVGFDEKRGDSVSVTALPFAEPVTVAGKHWYEEAWVADSAKSLVGALLIGVLAFGILKPLAPRLFQSPVELAAADHASLRDEASQMDSITLAPGESLEDLKAKLKPKKKGISAELLDTANTYDDKVAVVRMLVGEDAARVTNVFKQLMRSEMIN